MTLQDILDGIDWTFKDDDYAAWLDKIGWRDKEEQKDASDKFRRDSKETILDGALHLMVCQKCEYRDIRDPNPPYAIYTQCPLCEGDMTHDWANRLWARATMGPAWEQAEQVLRRAGMVTG
jgi:hypothetical protein